MSRRRDKQRKNSRRLSDRQILLLCGLTVFVLGIGLYVNTLGHGFVFDDATLIVQNPTLLGGNLWDLIGPSGYRPIRNLTYVFNYWIGGLDPFGYHLFNVVLHGINGLLVLLLLFRLVPRLWFAFPAALIFVSHPAQTAAVAYISGRKDLLATFFLVCGLLCYLRFRQDGYRKLWLGLAIASFILGCLSKEVALIFPGLVLCLEFVLAAQSGVKSPFTRMLSRYWPLLATLVLLASSLLLYSIYWAPASRAKGFWGGTISTHYGTSFKLFAHYVKQIIWPHPLVADYLGQVLSLSAGLLEPATLLCIALFVAFVLLALRSWKHHLLVGLGMSWFVLAILPVIQIIPFHELAADHFLYLPAIGFAILLGGGFEKLLTRPDFRVLGVAALVLLLSVYGWRTVTRNPAWKNPDALWTATYRDAPNSFRANCNLGSTAHREEKDTAKAIALTRRCLELQPEDPLPYANLGAMYRDLGLQALRANELGLAEEHELESLKYSQQSVELDPDNIWTISNIGDAYRDLALVYEFRGDLETAKALRARSFEFFNRILSGPTDHPQFPEIYYKTGAIFVDGGDYEAAVPYLTKVADVWPGHFMSQYVLGFSYYMLSDWSNACKYLEPALRLRSQPDIVVFLADSYWQLGKREQALSMLEQGVELFPASALVHFNLGRYYQEVGQGGLAKQHLEQVCGLDPNGELCQQASQRLGQD